MKKIFTTLAMTAFVMTGFAQQYQQYWRVEFTVPVTGNAYGTNNAVAATMKDNYTYCNPENEYLDFQANGTLTARGEAKAMGFRSTTTNYTETSTFYLENGRIMKEALVSMGYSVTGGGDSPYLWVDVKGDSWAAFDAILKGANVVTTPGAGFGRAGEGYIRISSFNSRENVMEAVERLRTIRF